MTDAQRNWNIAKLYLKSGPNIKNIINALKYLLDGPTKYIIGEPTILPGYQIKPLLRGNLLEKLLSKIGTISTNAVKSLANKSGKFEGKLILKVVDTKFPTLKSIDYDLLRKAVKNELIPYLTQETSKYADYGIDRLGYDTRMSPSNMFFNPYTGLFESNAVKLNTFTFISPRIPLGNAQHYNSNTLGHTRTFTSEPGTLNIVESLSDWALHPINKGYQKAEKAATHHLLQLRKLVALLKEKKLPSILTELRIPILELYNTVPFDHIKHLQDSYLIRLLQENMLYASRNGYQTMRYPTRETAIKVEGYEPKYLFREVSKELLAIKLQERIGQIEYDLYQGVNPVRYRALNRELSNLRGLLESLKLESIGQVYTPLEETILKKYETFPKMFGKLFKDVPLKLTTDIKGNSWFEFSIPKDMLMRELQYKNGGVL